MDIRRIDLTPRSLTKQRPWHNKHVKHVLPFAVILLPGLVLSLALVPTSQAANANPHKQQLTSFVEREMRQALLAAEDPAPAAPVVAVVAPAPVVTATEPVAPAPAPVPVTAPAVDSSSAAAWAASPGVVCIRDHESGDNYSTDTGNGYYGAYQDSLSTWDASGGTGLPSDAPPAVQDQINYQIWLSGGWGQWGTAPGCGL